MKLRYFFDWSKDYLWADDAEAKEKYGYPADVDLMPLSQATRDMADRVWHLFVQSADSADENRAVIERQFQDASNELYRRIVIELGSGFEVLNEINGAA